MLKGMPLVTMGGRRLRLFSDGGKNHATEAVATSEPQATP